MKKSANPFSRAGRITAQKNTDKWRHDDPEYQKRIQSLPPLESDKIDKDFPVDQH